MRKTDLIKELEASKRKVAFLETAKKNLNYANDKLANAYTDLIKEANEEIDKLKERLDNKVERISELETRLIEKTRFIKVLENKNTSYSRSIQDLVDTVKRLDSKVSELEAKKRKKQQKKNLKDEAKREEINKDMTTVLIEAAKNGDTQAAMYVIELL